MPKEKIDKEDFVKKVYEIVNEMKSVGGDPIAYRIKEATVALRIKQADRIYLVPDEKSEKNVWI